MIPRLFNGAGLVAAAALTLVLTGCSPSEPAEAAAQSTGVAATEAVASLVSQPSSTLEAGDPATVIRVVDGDTVDVRRGGDEVRVRLLNVDTPETKHPSKAVQCLGPEATDLLESLLEPGDDVVLRYDEERLDRYDRTLAGVFEDEVLVNAEIARRGLGVPVVFEPNRRFHPEVLAAWNEAEAEGAGLHEPGLECSLPALVDPVTPGEPPAQSEIDELTAVLAAVGTGDQAWMEVHYTAVLPRVERVVSDHDRRVAKAEAERAEQRRAQAERAEAERAEQEAAERAAAKREAERQAQAEAERRAEAERAAQEQEQAQAQEQARAEAQAEAERQAEADRAAQEAEEDTSSGSSGSGDVYYANCDAARAAGAAPLHAGGPGYRSAMDGDGDGIACEPHPGAGSGSGSGSSSNKAPNRCYAPGGETYEYCDDQDASSGSSSGGSDSDSGAATSGSGGPVRGTGNVCPAGYPVKVSGSGKYHVPGGRSYDNTGSKRCYASPAAAEADGAVAAKG